ncbi:hypothetical protein BHM03_00041737 [Ensete ventricosum]|nr:hypothetical protein BHM03_00041737 [Ensete ventricosum]
MGGDEVGRHPSGHRLRWGCVREKKTARQCLLAAPHLKKVGGDETRWCKRVIKTEISRGEVVECRNRGVSVM